MQKTNVMRLLNAKKIKYDEREYDPELTTGTDVAKALNEDPNNVYKTLVTVNEKKRYFVFVIPVEKELNLKKAAKASNSKSIAMIHQKDLLPLTGYIHGGCSPIGMKKTFPTYLDQSMQDKEHIYVSGGKRGFQIGIDPKDLSSYCNATFSDLTD